MEVVNGELMTMRATIAGRVVYALVGDVSLDALPSTRVTDRVIRCPSECKDVAWTHDDLVTVEPLRTVAHAVWIMLWKRDDLVDTTVTVSVEARMYSDLIADGKHDLVSDSFILLLICLSYHVDEWYAIII
jgi:hypothetical protein